MNWKNVENSFKVCRNTFKKYVNDLHMKMRSIAEIN